MPDPRTGARRATGSLAIADVHRREPADQPAASRVKDQVRAFHLAAAASEVKMRVSLRAVVEDLDVRCFRVAIDASCF